MELPIGVKIQFGRKLNNVVIMFPLYLDSEIEGFFFL